MRILDLILIDCEFLILNPNFPVMLIFPLFVFIFLSPYPQCPNLVSRTGFPPGLRRITTTSFPFTIRYGISLLAQSRSMHLLQAP